MTIIQEFMENIEELSETQSNLNRTSTDFLKTVKQ